MEKRSQNGVRMIQGKEFLLAGRGTREAMEREREGLKAEWHLLRILPYGWGRFGRQIDDWSIWVHGRKRK